MVDRVDERHGHPVAVHDAEVDGLAVDALGWGGRGPGGAAMHRIGGGARVGHGARGVDQRGQPGRGLGREQVVEPRRAVGVGEEAVARVVGEPRRLGLQMRASRRERIGPEVVVREDRGHQERRRALAVGRVLDELQPLQEPRDGRGVVAGGGGEVLLGVRAPRRAQRGRDVGRHLALVEARAAALDHAAQHLRLARGAEDLAGARGGAVEEVGLAGGALQPALGERPVEGRARRHGHAALGVADRGGQHGAEPEPPPVGRQPAEGVHRAGDRDGGGLVHRDRRVAGRAQPFGVEPRGRAARAVERHHLLLARGLDQREGVAADPRHLRLADPQQDGGADRRVGRVAAPLQQVDRGAGRERVRGGAHPLDRVDGRPPRELEVSHGAPPLLGQDRGRRPRCPGRPAQGLAGLRRGLLGARIGRVGAGRSSARWRRVGGEVTGRAAPGRGLLGARPREAGPGPSAQGGGEAAAAGAQVRAVARRSAMRRRAAGAGPPRCPGARSAAMGRAARANA